VPRFYQIFESGLSVQSHKQHGRHASAIFGYIPAEQKVINNESKFHYLGYMYDPVISYSSLCRFKTKRNETVRTGCTASSSASLCPMDKPKNGISGITGHAVTLTFDPKTWTAHLCPKMHYRWKFGQNPSIRIKDITKTTSRTETCIDDLKTMTAATSNSGGGIKIRAVERLIFLIALIARLIILIAR